MLVLDELSYCHNTPHDKVMLPLLMHKWASNFQSPIPCLVESLLWWWRYCPFNPNSLDNKGSWRILKDIYCSVTMLRELGLTYDSVCVFIPTWIKIGLSFREAARLIFSTPHCSKRKIKKLINSKIVTGMVSSLMSLQGWRGSIVR